MRTAAPIFLNSIPILIMIGLIPLIRNDYYLTLAYAALITVLLVVRRYKNDVLVFVIGFISMTIFEALFISTGVEIFLRDTLFGIMPLWLPFLWGYGFVVIKRSVQVLERA